MVGGARQRASRLADRLMLAIVLAMLVLPVAWVVLSAFRPRTEVAALPPRLLVMPTLENFVELFARTDFALNTLNSLIVASGSTALGLVLAVPATFAMSWHRMTWPATATLFARMAPGTLFLLPWFLMFTQAGLTGTHLALVLTHAVITLPVAIWVLLPYFDAMPRELIESAQVDGATPIQALARVAVPVVAPGIVVAAILCFVYSWNYFLFALVLSGFNSKTAIVASFNFIGEGVTNWGALMAAATVIAAPPLVLTILIQRRLVAGLAAGAVKG
jgi:multiple sugar transport system permease protein